MTIYLVAVIVQIIKNNLLLLRRFLSTLYVRLSKTDLPETKKKGFNNNKHHILYRLYGEFEKIALLIFCIPK